MHGSAPLVQTLIENDLVDELRLMVFRFVLGTGRPVRRDQRQAPAVLVAESRTVGEGRWGSTI